VSFDSPQLRTDLASRSGELAQARAKLENAQRGYDRLSKLLERGIASRRELEDARKELDDAQAALETATAARSGAAELSGRAQAKAPFDGIVAQRWHNPGDLVEANEHVLRLVDPKRLEVEAAVPAGDAARIAIGRPARVGVAGSAAGSASASASVVSHPALVDPATGTAGVRLRLETALAVGTPVEVEIAAEEEHDALVVPASAVVTEGDLSAVFVVDAKKHAQRRTVTLGVRNAGEVQVRSGLKAGEVVVVKGAQELPDGALVAAGR
jgi:membrane fusion protein (multidrug efflux system)